jgi:hypothetical protein
MRWLRLALLILAVVLAWFAVSFVRGCIDVADELPDDRDDVTPQ